MNDTKQRLNRRLAGMLKARLPELGLDEVQDRRRRQGRRWPLATILRTVLVGLVSGRQSLAELEALTDELATPMRRLLGIPRRLADTTMRNVLTRVLPFALRQVIHRLIKSAIRRKALPLEGFPFHGVALDGKATATPSWDNHYAQRKTYDDGRQAHGLVRTVNAVLFSTPAKPVLDSVPIPAETNEMGIFPAVFEALTRTYGSLFRLVTYDAGVTSEDNCRVVVEAGKDFLFHVKNENWLVVQEAKRLLGSIPPAKAKAHTEDVLDNATSLHRRVFLCAVLDKCFWGFPHAKTIVRVSAEKVKNGRILFREDRYYISSLKATELRADQWLCAVRNHWAVENNCHWIADTIFNEDDKPWIEADPRGTVVMMLLRRIAYNLLALFRTVTQRSEEKRQEPWRNLLRWMYHSLISTTDEQVENLRSRKLAAAVR